MTGYHLAQFNAARLRAPLDDPATAGFVAGLDLMNALADRSPGFVWRLAEGPAGDATTVRPTEPDVIVTLSVWESVEALRAFTYQSEHLDYLRRRREWFVPLGYRASLVLWWIPAGTLPTPEEGVARLRALGANGPTPDAFTFRAPFPAPATTDAAPPAPLPARPA
ncbi:DUF3291 domain-containing protein [Catenuloplanes atrovinosus]|uniref:Heme-degrading monooxygenase HmoA n=1 Tax=Catenuloplanes atrovinosus TaxID=137266 RepID=A0AAE4C727_9ACTN|nr:DUF3291 domain-containing protein [Catenuloplanes atrovinosus]MDR7273418.1 heme-degrading monooxygenase HmoA [Catenuloplanes atrovinosus]